MCKVSKKSRLFLNNSFFYQNFISLRLWFVSNFFKGVLVLKNDLGFISIAFLSKQNQLFSVFLSNDFFKKKPLDFFGGFLLKSIFLQKIGSTLSDVFFKKVSLGSSYNSFCYLSDNLGFKIILRLPSGSFFSLKKGFFKENTYRKKKKKKKVRGIVMNPVDHPNGGSSRSRNPFYTP